VSIDLDVVIFDDITDLFPPAEDFKILTGTSAPYNGSLWALTTGTHPDVWASFDPQTAPGLAQAPLTAAGQHYYGSDQAWLSYTLPGAATWSQADGIWQYRSTLWREKGAASRPVPPECRMLFFAGNVKPWSPQMRALHPHAARTWRQALHAGYART
jgi:hypothetical protein